MNTSWKSRTITRREFVRDSAATAGLIGLAAPEPEVGGYRSGQAIKEAKQYSHRTQFDAQLLRESVDSGPLVASSHGRQLLVDSDGTVLTALAWNGSRPALQLWREHKPIAQHLFSAAPSSPFLLMSKGGSPILWISVGNEILCARTLTQAPVGIPGLKGTLQDALTLADGRTLLALLDGRKLFLACFDGSKAEQALIDGDAGRAALETDSEETLHLAFEKRQGIEYRRFERGFSLGKLVPGHSERAAEAFAFHPTLSVQGKRLILAYLGESCRLRSSVAGSPAWERLGQGGYVGVLIRENEQWSRHRLADSRQIIKPLRPVDAAYGGGTNTELLTAVEEFGPPSLVLGPDGVLLAMWANITRRWIYGSRLLGSTFSDMFEVRGPLEQLAGPCLPARRVPSNSAAIPMTMLSSTRAYLDRIAIAPRSIKEGRRLDFVQWDDLAESRGLDLVVNQMIRRRENPVIPVGKRGEMDDAAVVADITREGTGWRASIAYITAVNADPNSKDRGWRWDGVATSADGLHWTKQPPQPLSKQYTVDNAGDHVYPIRIVVDRQERNPEWRYKGLWRSPNNEPWGYLAVVSADGARWTQVKDNNTVIRADDDLRLWIDPDDVPERRFKASAIGRSFCGRVCVQWTSADGMHWNDERDTLDYKDPFNARPDRGSTGRILLDSWSGPDEEDEIHGGYVFRDGDRWLLHYMKWTYDGHIYCGLASSRDGINFSRVGGGAVTLPLGDPGCWDAGRVALREAPHRVDGIWRQYYTGCGWKHGMGGIGAKTSHFGINAPNQMGLAEIPVGQWVHLELRRRADLGEMLTVPLRLEKPHNLTLDIEGIQPPSDFIECAVVNPEGQDSIEGFDYKACDRIPDNGRRIPVTWRGRKLSSLGRRDIRLGIRLKGYGIRLFGADLQPA